MKQWHCSVKGKHYGPVSEEDIRNWISQGRISSEDYLWTAGMSQWISAGSAMPDMFPDFQSQQATASMVPAVAGAGTLGKTPNAKLTERSRSRLRGKWGLAIAFSLLLIILNFAINHIPYLGWLISQMVSGPLALGAVVFYLTYTRRGQAELTMIFAGFKRFAAALGAYVLVNIFVLLWSIALAIPGLIILAVSSPAISSLKQTTKMLQNSPDGFTLTTIAATLAVIPGIVAGIIAQLRYSQTMYLLADDRNLGPLAAIRKSTEMMAGHKQRLFWLGLRFLGWAILCALTLGIGLLWFMPYLATTFACFYDDLRPPLATAGVSTNTSREITQPLATDEDNPPELTSE